MTTANYPQSTEENTEAQARPQTTGLGLVLCLSGSKARAVSGAGGWGTWSRAGRVRRLVLQAAFDLPFLPVWLCWPGMWPWPWQAWCRTPSWGAQSRTCSPEWKGAPLPVLPWVEGAAGALGTPSLPTLLGSVLPESRDSWVWAPRTSHQLSAGARSRLGALPGSEGGAGGDERAFVSLSVKMGMTASHWGGLLLLEVSGQSPVGGSALCLSGVGDASLGLQPPPHSQLWSPSTHTLPPEDLRC